ncbi:MAG TPA: SRPBCC family protein [Acidimicrobiales bacterium]|nr:SRPBCC family protein [Acidimicrobiales bacterium]
MPSTSPYVIDYRASFSLPRPPAEVWAALERVDRFESWWRWLSELRLEGGGLRAGSVLYGVVSPPVPYRMRVRVELEDCEAPYTIDAAVHGDLEGRAGLLLEETAGGTLASVGWTIEMTQAPMRVAARLARPLLLWGHDRVVDATVAGFRRQLAGSGPGQHQGRPGQHHRPGHRP